MFGPKLIEEMDSPYSGKLRVLQGWGYKYIATGVLTQSGGLVKDVWEPIIKNHKILIPNSKSCLILGLAAGTLAGLLAKLYPGIEITGVEIDPAMISLGRKYFHLDQIPGLKIITGDAGIFVRKSSRKFDCILVDLYIGDRLPEFVYSLGFLKKLKQLSPLVIVNHLFYDDIKRKNAQKLVTALQSVFPRVVLKRVLTNLMIICS